MRVEITDAGSDGGLRIGGYSTTLKLDGMDVSRHCTGLSLEIKVGEPIVLNASFVVKELDIVLDDVEPQLTADEVSKQIRDWLKAQAATN